MIVVNEKNFKETRSHLLAWMREAPVVKTERWQGVPVNTDTRELRNVVFDVALFGIENLDHWRGDVAPNLPWADAHFKERVGGEPLNPGEEWKNWPWGQSADKFRATNQRFNHTYAERLWPKFMRRTPDGKLPARTKSDIRAYPEKDPRPFYIAGHHVGDLQNLVELLVQEPHTRQAWIPLFFPSETGFGDGGRKMCSLGYHFLVRDNKAHVWYPLRSCDMRRHWADDCYLAVRLLLWVIDRCRERSGFWRGVVPGSYAMHMTSLHIFENDHDELMRGKWQ